MRKITFQSLCGEHIFSGVELTSERIKTYWTEEDCNVILFTLDGITYKLVENPDDGYRSYCGDIEISDVAPKYNFQGIRVICSMMEDGHYEKNDCIVLRDCENGEIVLEAGTMNYDDYYPYCHFAYYPENMSCNKNKE